MTSFPALFSSDCSDPRTGREQGRKMSNLVEGGIVSRDRHRREWNVGGPKLWTGREHRSNVLKSGSETTQNKPNGRWDSGQGPRTHSWYQENPGRHPLSVHTQNPSPVIVSTPRVSLVSLSLWGVGSEGGEGGFHIVRTFTYKPLPFTDKRKEKKNIKKFSTSE